MTKPKTDKHPEPIEPAAGEAVEQEIRETSDPGEDREALKKQAAEAKEHWERLLRTTAEFDNFRKRAARDREEAIRYANHALLERLLPVLDGFDMAVTAAETSGTEATPQSLKDGINLILQQFKSVLKDAGLEEIEAHGKLFDPNFHEAVSQVETSEVQEGHVAQQLRKGYLLRDRLVRPSTVVVARKPAE
jgi:molecular chaperone GrpE